MYKTVMPSGVTTDVEQVARLFHALSDKTRLLVVQRLQTGEQCVCDLTDAFKTGQSRLSFHLKVLKDAGLVNDRRDGRWIYYSLNQSGLEELESFLKDMKKRSHGLIKSQCC
jgi:ArsR family transcriptional regulator, arsenate/arsenite/antimonite-responsive transcriptional repressor